MFYDTIKETTSWQIGVCGGNWMKFFVDEEKRHRLEVVDRVVDDIRHRFGFYSIQRGVMYTDKALSHLNAKDEHVVHPHGCI